MKSFIAFIIISITLVTLSIYLESKDYDPMKADENHWWQAYATQKEEYMDPVFPISQKTRLVFWFSGAPTYRLCMKDMKEIMDDPGNIYSKGSEEPYGCAYKGSNKYISMFMYSFIMEKEHFACLLEFTSPKGIKMNGKYSPILKGYEQSCKFESSGEIQYKVLLGN